MSLADILTTDVGAVGGRLRDFLVWWHGELADMVAPLLAPMRRSRAMITAEARAEGGYLIRRRGYPDRVHDGSPISAALTLPSNAVLIRALAAPPLPPRDIRQMMMLDLDRLTPFPVDAAYHDLVILPGDGGKTQVRLAATPRLQADAALVQARRAGLQPTAVVAAGEDGVLFDFLPSIRASVGMRLSRVSLVLWSLVVAMLALNLCVAIWRDSDSLASLQASVAVQQPVVDHIRQVRQQTLARTAEAAARLQARAAGEPLRVLDAVSRALPDGVWAERLSWNGATVRLTGRRPASVDVVGALRREPRLGNVRDADAASSGADSFDVLADVTPPKAERAVP
jgi:general secretion pathway protein L